MLSLLCRSPDVVDSAFYDTQSHRSRTRRSIRGVSIPGLGRSSSGSKKKRILKGSIGSPTDFKHEAHVGIDNMMAPTGSWDLDQWRTELEKHMQVQPIVAHPEPASTPPAVAPASPSPVGSPAPSVIVPRRKPVPSLLPPSNEVNLTDQSPLSSVASSPTRTTLLDDATPSVVLV